MGGEEKLWGEGASGNLALELKAIVSFPIIVFRITPLLHFVGRLGVCAKQLRLIAVPVEVCAMHSIDKPWRDSVGLV